MFGLFAFNGCVAMAADTTAPPLPDSGSPLAGILDLLTGKFGWLAQVIGFLGSLRLLLKPVMSMIEANVAGSEQKSAALRDFEAGPIFKFIAFILDYTASVKLKAVTVAAKSVPPAMLAFLLLPMAAMLMAGCAHLSPAADPLIVRVEQTETVAYTTLDTFLQIDNSDRAFFRTNVPALHAFAEYLRQPQRVDGTNIFPRWAAYVKSLDDVKLSYKGGMATSNSVVTALAVLETAVSQAQQYITLTTSVTNR